MRVPKPVRLLSVGLLMLGCRPAEPDTTASPKDAPATVTTAAQPAPKPAVQVEVQAEPLRTHVSFLADDAQQGRPPGTPADLRVQDYIEAQFKAAGLQPGLPQGFRQNFEVTDGVKTTATTLFKGGKKPIDHAVVPFSTATTDPTKGRLVFMGYGLAPKGVGSGDYKGLEAKVKGSIVVVLGGGPPDNPHIPPSQLRPQSKLIAARDHGAVGFVLWEPDATQAFPNHGEAADLRLPAVWVGKAGSETLARMLGSKTPTGTTPKDLRLKAGKRSRKPAQIHTPITPVVLKTANVAAMLPGSGTSDQVVIVGAHMDHLGLGTSSSLAPGAREVHNGADDNASGVAVVIELAKAMATLPAEQRPYDLHFVTFGAEEMGLLGSKHYVKSLDPGLKKRVVAMFNFDMVGRLRPDGLVVSGIGTSSVWPKMVEAAAGSLKIRPDEDGYGASDQTSFYEEGIPVLHFFTGSHSDYHKPSDDTDKINFEGAAEVANVALSVLRPLVEQQIVPDYIKVARKAPTRGGFRVSLGTMPDYGAKVDGLRLSGVREGGPADKAGLKKGDVITKLDGREIHNLDDYMATFTMLKPDVAVEVVVMRDGQEVNLTLTPAAPKRR